MTDYNAPAPDAPTLTPPAPDFPDSPPASALCGFALPNIDILALIPVIQLPALPTIPTITLPDLSALLNLLPAIDCSAANPADLSSKLPYGGGRKPTRPPNYEDD
jgi:hypothetical protein